MKRLLPEVPANESGDIQIVKKPRSFYGLGFLFRFLLCTAERKGVQSSVITPLTLGRKFYPGLKIGELSLYIHALHWQRVIDMDFIPKKEASALSEFDNHLNLPARTGKSAAESGRRSQTLRGLKIRENLLAYTFLSPSLLLFGVFLFYPLLRSVYLSMHSTDPAGRIHSFIGLDNFRALMSSGDFLSGIRVTALFALYTVPASILLALLLAALAHHLPRGRRLFQFSFSLPMVLSVGSSAVIWKFLFHPTLGMLNYGLELARLPPISWLTDPGWALLSVSLMTVWMNLGFNFIILSGGLGGIPEEMYESAKIDGAGPISTFGKITVPLLSPTLFFVLIVSVISAFQSFAQIHILTQGGPMNSTDVFVYSIYREAFVNFRFGTGSAQSLLLFAVIMLLTLIQFKWVERKVHYQ